MRKYLALLLILLSFFVLSACGQSPVDAPGQVSPPTEEETHLHQPPTDTNVLEHESGGYCGNTATTVSCLGLGKDGEAWEKTFYFDDSVALTDLLRFLKYDGDVCRCPPEYTVDTELGEGYDINLTEGFARYEGGQTDLTAEQLEQISQIIERVRDD